MSLTIGEFTERLQREEECSLLEILNASSEDLVNRFSDVIGILYENKYLVEEYEDEEEDE